MPTRVEKHAGGAPRVGSSDLATQPRARFRHDVEGLRAVAILLVATYHVWGDGQVSGGVDVFLVVSGFLVGGGLLRRLGRGEPFALGSYVASLGRRLLPPLLLTLAAVVVGTWLWLPRSEFSDVSGGVLASAAYVENWRMAIAGQAYEAADPVSSPVQHIWSLSVQGQLFVGVPLLLLGLRLGLARVGMSPDRARRALVGAVAVAALASFVWAGFSIGFQQDVAYLDTGARAWEYLAGTLVAAAAPAVRLRRPVALVVGWVGLTAIVATGLVLDARAAFPGPAALVPVVGAAMVLLAGLRREGDERGAVAAILGWRPLARAGGYAYEFYLWHWVVLVMALAATGRESFGWLAGGVVLVVSAIAAWIARRLTGRLVPDRTPSERPAGGRAAAPRVAVAATLALALAAPAGWIAYRASDPWTGIEDLDLATNPGALTLLDPERWPTAPAGTHTPSAINAVHDWPIAALGCPETQRGDAQVYPCVLGDPDGATTVALAGNSHAIGYGVPLDAVARESGVRVEAFFKLGCPLSVQHGAGGDDALSCQEWSAEVMHRLETSDAVAVLTAGTRSARGVDEADGDYVPDSYVEAWERLIDRGIAVAPIRNAPHFERNMRTCVEVSASGPESCAGSRAQLLGTDPLEAAVSSERYTPLDLSDVICDEALCHAVVGNVLVYIDEYHLTATFGRTLAPALAEQLRGLQWWPG